MCRIMFYRIYEYMKLMPFTGWQGYPDGRIGHEIRFVLKTLINVSLSFIYLHYNDVVCLMIIKYLRFKHQQNLTYIDVGKTLHVQKFFDFVELEMYKRFVHYLVHHSKKELSLVR